MNPRRWLALNPFLFVGLLFVPLVAAQPGQEGQPPEKKDFGKKDFPFGSKGPGGFGGPMNQRRKLVAKFDKDGDGRLNAEERQAAREYVKKEGGAKGGFGKGGFGKGGFGKGGPGGKKGFGGFGPGPGFGPPGGFGKGGKGREPAKPGIKVTPAEVKSYPDAKLYDTTILRTIFLEFENRTDWEAELSDFYRSDVEVPATVIVDGKRYPNVGVHFRGNSSYFMAPAGYKHSLNLSFDFVDNKQRLYGYKTLNLLNGAEDPSFMHTVLYCNLARQFIPAPRANFVKVVINGENWGIFANQQQFNKEFIQENYKTTKGARWRVPGNPGASAGLGYIGDNVEDYKRHYQIKSKDNAKDWKALVELCRVLNKTPLNELEETLKPILDIESTLWFLALDNAVINDDGYWTRASDYSLYRDPKGKFHLTLYDANESFQAVGGGFGGPKGGFGGPKGGPGGFGGPGFGGPKGGPGDFGGPKGGGFGKGPMGGPKGGKGASGYGLDPLVDVGSDRMPLYRLLEVPELRRKYLRHMYTIVNEKFDWKKIKPVLDQYRSLIENEIEIDTRKLYSLAEFHAAFADTPTGSASRENLRAFFDGRRKYLLNHPEIKKVAGN